MLHVEVRCEKVCFLWECRKNTTTGRHVRSLNDFEKAVLLCLNSWISLEKADIVGLHL